MLTEVVALFWMPLQESAMRGLDNSQMDARGELGLALIRDVIQQGHTENLFLLQTELCEAVSCVGQAQPTPAPLNTMELVVPVPTLPISYHQHRS